VAAREREFSFFIPDPIPNDLKVSIRENDKKYRGKVAFLKPVKHTPANYTLLCDTLERRIRIRDFILHSFEHDKDDPFPGNRLRPGQPALSSLYLYRR
jgi:hypothetical protein